MGRGDEATVWLLDMDWLDGEAFIGEVASWSKVVSCASCIQNRFVAVLFVSFGGT